MIAGVDAYNTPSATRGTDIDATIIAEWYATTGTNTTLTEYCSTGVDAEQILCNSTGVGDNCVLYTDSSSTFRRRDWSMSVSTNTDTVKHVTTSTDIDTSFTHDWYNSATTNTDTIVSETIGTEMDPTIMHEACTAVATNTDRVIYNSVGTDIDLSLTSLPVAVLSTHPFRVFSTSTSADPAFDADNACTAPSTSKQYAVTTTTTAYSRTGLGSLLHNPTSMDVRNNPGKAHADIDKSNLLTNNIPEMTDTITLRAPYTAESSCDSFSLEDCTDTCVLHFEPKAVTAECEQNNAMPAHVQESELANAPAK